MGAVRPGTCIAVRELKNWECAAAVPWTRRGECAAAVSCRKQVVRFGLALDSAGVRFGRPWAWERSSGLAGLAACVHDVLSVFR